MKIQSFLMATLFTATWACAQGPLSPSSSPAPSMKTLAQVEPRIPVDATNTPGDGSSLYNITNAGSYYLVSNIEVSAGNGVRIFVPNVTLDLNGFKVSSSAGSGVAVFLEPAADQCVVRNGTIDGFFSGVLGSSSSDMHIRDLIVTGTSSNGIQVGPQATVENCIVEDIGGSGIVVGIVSLIRNCTVRTTGAHGIFSTETSLVEGNVLNNCDGDAIRVANRCIVRNNICDFPPASGAGIRVTGNQGESRIENNNIMRRGVGIRIDGPDNYVANNTVRECGTNYVFAANNHLNLLLSEIPQSINWPAYVKLAGSLVGVAGADGITIESDDVTIDLAGHTLRAPAGSGSGIGITEASGIVSYTNITIRNGAVRDWPENGIHLLDAVRCRIEHVSVLDNTFDGMNIGDGSVVERCIAAGNGQAGIEVHEDCVVWNCTASGNAIGIQCAARSRVEDCDANNNANGGISVGYRNVIRNNNVRDNGFNLFTGSGIGVTGGSGSMIDGNVLIGNNNAFRQSGNASNMFLVRNVMIDNTNANLSGSFFGSHYGEISTPPTGAFSTNNAWANFGY